MIYLLLPFLLLSPLEAKKIDRLQDQVEHNEQQLRDLYQEVQYLRDRIQELENRIREIDVIEESMNEKLKEMPSKTWKWRSPKEDVKQIYTSKYRDQRGHRIGKWDTISQIEERTC